MPFAKRTARGSRLSGERWSHTQRVAFFARVKSRHKRKAGLLCDDPLAHCRRRDHSNRIMAGAWMLLSDTCSPAVASGFNFVAQVWKNGVKLEECVGANKTALEGACPNEPCIPD